MKSSSFWIHIFYNGVMHLVQGTYTDKSSLNRAIDLAIHVFNGGQIVILDKTQISSDNLISFKSNANHRIFDLSLVGNNKWLCSIYVNLENVTDLFNGTLDEIIQILLSRLEKGMMLKAYIWVNGEKRPYEPEYLFEKDENLKHLLDLAIHVLKGGEIVTMDTFQYML
eukprot:NODE_724_length_4442_cov_0.403868.p2 type:complete len:168 gc:universal NODE_724_length_4442_cov_0.403868:2331-2834(+)